MEDCYFVYVDMVTLETIVNIHQIHVQVIHAKMVVSVLLNDEAIDATVREVILATTVKQ